jgi:hypothetical protein
MIIAIIISFLVGVCAAFYFAHCYFDALMQVRFDRIFKAAAKENGLDIRIVKVRDGKDAKKVVRMIIDRTFTEPNNRN